MYFSASFTFFLILNLTLSEQERNNILRGNKFYGIFNQRKQNKFCQIPKVIVHKTKYIFVLFCKAITYIRIGKNI